MTLFTPRDWAPDGMRGNRLVIRHAQSTFYPPLCMSRHVFPSFFVVHVRAICQKPPSAGFSFIVQAPVSGAAPKRGACNCPVFSCRPLRPLQRGLSGWKSRINLEKALATSLQFTALLPSVTRLKPAGSRDWLDAETSPYSSSRSNAVDTGTQEENCFKSSLLYGLS